MIYILTVPLTVTVSAEHSIPVRSKYTSGPSNGASSNFASVDFGLQKVYGYYLNRSKDILSTSPCLN
jgi:hypothetical protein